MSDELLDGPLGPLPAQSYPRVHGRPSLIINISLTHPLTHEGLGDLGLEI